jgi:hypothetical protein
VEEWDIHPIKFGHHIMHNFASWKLVKFGQHVIDTFASLKPVRFGQSTIQKFASWKYCLENSQYTGRMEAFTPSNITTTKRCSAL